MWLVEQAAAASQAIVDEARALDELMSRRFPFLDVGPRRVQRDSYDAQ